MAIWSLSNLWPIGLIIFAVLTTILFGLAFSRRTKAPAPDLQRV